MYTKQIRYYKKNIFPSYRDYHLSFAIFSKTRARHVQTKRTNGIFLNFTVHITIFFYVPFARDFRKKIQ